RNCSQRRTIRSRRSRWPAVTETSRHSPASSGPPSDCRPPPTVNMPDAMSEKRRIALVGGTFDPVHLGHLHLASVAREGLMLDEVHFQPCRISTHKTGRPPTPSADRVEMLHRATEPLPWAVVDEMELRREGPSF